MSNKIIVISTGWKCEEYMGRCIDSVTNQDIKGFEYDHHVIVDEPEFPARKGKVYNFVKMLISIHPEPDDIICDVDLDDYLDPWALSTINRTYYYNAKLLLTYGSFRMESGRPSRFNGEYKTKSFRTEKWKASHLKTFRYKLFKQIKLNDLKGPDGKPLMVCADMAMMFPMLEMAGLDRIKHITECLYCYNDLSPYNDHKMDGEGQKRTERWIRKKPRYQRREF